ncbi:MAG: HindIII family type II restriction endonuclease [Clostridiales Family XIII bacterium]|jgi:type II restriction enzyme|nr:HindIII family type II restriction endonuclease [Clostridiales Family XIII bacterium]
MFQKLLKKIEEVSNKGFVSASEELIRFIDQADGFMELIVDIGTIPESIAHDSTEEKLFSKASDAVLARAFREIGLQSSVLAERADSADVEAKSLQYGYRLVADAKAFRLSRTAKNQKDFKVGALSGWRKDADFAVLCSPYFQYSRKSSQIYRQSLDNNVCLLSWEHLIYLLANKIKESNTVNLSPIWNFGKIYSSKINVETAGKDCFVNEFNILFLDVVGEKKESFISALEKQRDKIFDRGEVEKAYWDCQKEKIRRLSKDQAIDELIRAKKINEKISQITRQTGGLFE